MDCNTILNNDPLGNVVPEDDKKRLEIYTKKTEIRKGVFGLGKLKERKNKNYNEAFANLIKELDSKEETYDFSENSNLTNELGEKISGKFSYDGSKFNIEYSVPDESFGSGIEGVMFEEAYHALQFTQGKFTFENQGGKWNPKGIDATDELEAKRFASTAPGVLSTYRTRFGLASTQLGFILKSSDAEAIKFLIKGAKKDAVYDPNRGTVIYSDHNAAYPSLGAEKVNSKLDLRTFNINEVGYPFK
jgi:hypothetical protein